MKDILQYLFGRLKDERPVTHRVGSVDYAVKADGTLGEAVRQLAPQWTAPTMEVSTLTGLGEIYTAKLDDFPEKVALHVSDPWTVELLALVADEFGRRHVWARAKHRQDVPFKLDTWLKPEAFLIAFRASFLLTDDAVKVIQVCSTVGAGEAILVADDGISQEITVKSGTVTKSAVTLPAEGIPLIPWRTFRDAPPVESKFLLRMRGVKDSVPEIALFEIDARWRLDTMQSVAVWLEEHVPNALVIA